MTAMRGVLTQLQVIHALLLREVKTRFGDSRLGYGWALLEPMFWIGPLVVLYYALGRPAPYGLPVFPFLITGMVPFLMWRHTVTRAIASISGNAGLLAYPQVRPLDLVVARAVLECTTYLIVLTLLMGGQGLFSGNLRVDSVLEVLVGFFLTAALGSSLGLVFCGLNVFLPVVEKISNVLVRMAFWGSAVFYPADAMPARTREIILYNPLAHSIELIRDGWFAGYSAQHVSILYPAYWVLVLLFFGLSLERVARRRLELAT